MIAARRIIHLALAVSAVGLAFAVVATPAGSTPNYDWPGMKKCGTFKAQYKIYVYAKNIRCSTARRIQKEYWLGPDRRKVIHNGGAGAAGWITLKRYPGWKCTSGAGGGGCNRGKKSASYQN